MPVRGFDHIALPTAHPEELLTFYWALGFTATDVDDKLFKMANRGTHIAVAAPGVDVLAAAPDGGYQMTTGTSFAAAQVSGVAALILDHPSIKIFAAIAFLLGLAALADYIRRAIVTGKRRLAESEAGGEEQPGG